MGLAAPAGSVLSVVICVAAFVYLKRRGTPISEKLSDNFVIFEKKKNILVMSDGMIQCHWI